MHTQKKIHIIKYNTGIGAGNPGCGDGPKVIEASSYLSTLDLSITWDESDRCQETLSGMAAMPTIAKLCEKLATRVKSHIVDENFFLSLGGDQSCSAGTWSGASAGIKYRGDLGLIWIDAHMDAHTPETTPSQNIHGMPLAALLGHGDPLLTGILDPDPKLKANNICLIGIRSYESGEADLLEKLGVKIFFDEEVQARGIETIMQEAHDHVNLSTHRFGISIDMDGIDPEAAPGVGTPVPKGIPAKPFLEALKKISVDPKLIGAEIVEFNPHLDLEHKTEKLLIQFIATFAGV